MRKNIFEIMQGNQLNLYDEYLRIQRLFEFTHFNYENSIKKYLQCNNYFTNWKYRKRYISIDDLLISLKIDYKHMESPHITVEKLLLYCETIFNLVKLIDYDTLDCESISLIDAIQNNIVDLLEDLNYEINSNNNSQFIIIEKNTLTSAVAEKFPEITNTVIEYRRFALKGNVEAKERILDALANKVEPLKVKFKGTSYKQIIEDIGMMLNNLNIRHNNLDGPKKQNYTTSMTSQELENWYDTLYDLMLTALMIEDYNNKKQSIEELKMHY